MIERRSRRASRFTVLAVLAGLVLAFSLVPSIAVADDASRTSAVVWDPLGLALHDRAVSFLSVPAFASAPYDERAAVPSQLPWLGATPRLSFVARDWNASQLLWGHLTVSDQMRLSRSSRMGVTRLRLAGGRLAPFAQIGVGQWRVDTTVVATLPTDVELAGELGAGFELEVAPHAVIALQGDCTFVFPEGREPAMLASGHLWGTLLAARARF